MSRTRGKYDSSAANWVDESANITGKTCATVGQFVVVGDEWDVQWCAIGNVDSWPTPATDAARAVQSGLENMETTYGVVTGITGGDFYGYVFQERAITKMTYVGGDVVFTFDIFETTRGCFEFNRYVQVDDVVYYESEFGYHALINDQVQDIGFGRVDDSYPPSRPSFVITGTYPQQSVAVNQSISTIFFEDNKLAYNYKTDKWTRVPGLTTGAFFSIDSKTGIIGQIEIGATQVVLLNSTDGAFLDALIETSEVDPNTGGRWLTGEVRPLINESTGTSVKVRLGTRNTISSTVNYTATATPQTDTGLVPLRKDARYHRLEIEIEGGFDTAIGVDIEGERTGRQ